MWCNRVEYSFSSIGSIFLPLQASIFFSLVGISKSHREEPPPMYSARSPSLSPHGAILGDDQAAKFI